MNIKENSLKRALTAKCLSELPKQFREDGGEYWLEAIILVRKRDGSQSYVSGKRSVDGKIIYTADYGEMSPIAGLISVHPYLYLDKNKYMPYKTVEQKRHALAQYIGGDDDAKKAVEELPDSEVEYQILQIAIEAQYSGASINKTHEAITNAVKSTKVSDKKENTSEEREFVPEKQETKNDDGKESQGLQDTKSKIGRPRKPTTKA